MVERIVEMMGRQENIRNISVIAHVDHGKTTLSDSLMGKAGLIAKSQQGNKTALDTTEEERNRGITIKSTGVSLYYERKEEKEETPYLINLIDSPGHVDFSSEVTAALRITDGALVVVCCVEGVCVQTETVLRQAITERVRPVLFLNKVDRIFMETKPSLEEAYVIFRKSIESVNVICQTYQDATMGDVSVYPQLGKVGFGSGKQAWGFTLKDFARMYSSRFGVSQEKMMEYLWGEHYWCPEENAWVEDNRGGKLMRGFCQFILHPMKVLFDAIMGNDKKCYESILDALQLRLSKKEIKATKSNKDFLKLVMSTWLPAGDALLDMVVDHLPSPLQAQQYRLETLYSGPLDSREAMAIRKCDAEGPMTMYVSKMVPTQDNSRFIAFGRVFSGVVKTGQEIRIMGPDFVHGEKKDLFVKKIQGTLLMQAGTVKPITSCPAGNICGLMGIDQYLLKSGTLSTSSDMHPFHTMKFSVAAVVQVAVAPLKAADLPKLVDGLKRLSHADPLVKCSMSKTGEHIIAGAGELHLDICLKDLRKDFMKGGQITVSEPIVSFAETVTNKTGEYGNYPNICVGKSPNKHNRLYVRAEPLSEKTVTALDDGSLQLFGDMKVFGRRMSDEYGWNVEEGRSIWSFGCPPDATANALIDMTKGIQYLGEAKEHIVNAFKQSTASGILCEEVMRGIKFTLTDAKLHPDAMHRGPAQLIPAAQKTFFASELASGPRLMEPLYLVNISVPQTQHSGVRKTLNSKRGEIESIENRVGNLTVIKAYLPVVESFGFTQLLRKNTGGKAFPQMQFSHWRVMSGDPFASGSMPNKFICDTRKRKGLNEEMPKFSDYYDKI